jgi:hypothetical protein
MAMGRRPRSAVTLCIPLIGCLTGDFGRVRPSLTYDDMHAWVGERAAESRAIPPSTFPLTEEERLLRDLAYPLIAPAYDRWHWLALLEEYGWQEQPLPDAPYDVTAYANVLLTEPRRAANSLYARLIDDIRNDVTRLGPFFVTARQVTDMDVKRRKSLAYVSALTKPEYDNAMRRVAENALTIDWVYRSLRNRAASYRFAMERLVIIVPVPMAVEAERQLTLLTMQLDRLHAAPPVPVAAAPRPLVTKD